MLHVSVYTLQCDGMCPKVCSSEICKEYVAGFKTMSILMYPG